ncbi:CPBP family intramembrane glutamic endopeptidase [Leucobacter sp. BZR 635]
MTAEQIPENPNQQPTRVPWGAVALFVGIALGLAWLVALPMWGLVASNSASLSIGQQLLAQLTPIAVMFTPAVAMLVVVFLARTPRTGRARFLGLWPLRPAKRVVWFIVLGALAPILLVAASLAVATLFGWFTPDLANLSGFAAVLASSGAPAESAKAVALTQLVMLPLAGLINILPAFGEEVGWRGWLLPALRPLGTWPALLISGVIWGIWHAPLTLLGHNFGLFDWRGVALMTVGSVSWGILFGWLRLRSGSVWPAVIAHGALNGAAGIFVLFGMAGAPLPLALVNPLGVSGWIVAAIVIAVLVLTGQFSRQPELAARRR